jgi:hypothetical protein
VSQEWPLCQPNRILHIEWDLFWVPVTLQPLLIFSHVETIWWYFYRSWRPRTLENRTTSTHLSEMNFKMDFQENSCFQKEQSQIKYSKTKGTILAVTTWLYLHLYLDNGLIEHLAISMFSGVTLPGWEVGFYLLAIGQHLFNRSWPLFNSFVKWWFFGGTGVWTQGFALAKQALNSLSQTSSSFYSGYFGDGVLQTMIFLISASQLARIIGMSHQHLAVKRVSMIVFTS